MARLWSLSTGDTRPVSLRRLRVSVVPFGLSAKLANSIERSNALHKTYAPLDIEAVRNADACSVEGAEAHPCRERKRRKRTNSALSKSINR